MLVVAEGIENQPTLDILAELGSDLAQGYVIVNPCRVTISLSG